MLKSAGGKQMTKGVAIGLLLAGLALAGCQQKSVIDKCVEAQAIAICNGLVPVSEKKSELFYKVGGGSEDECIQCFIKRKGGEWQMQCLKAQAGKE
jgi:hypothetical protein